MSPPAGQLHWSGLTDRGHVRPNNEDSFLALTFNGHDLSYLGKTGQASLAGADFVFAVQRRIGRGQVGRVREPDHGRPHHAPAAAQLPLSAAGMTTGFADILGELFSAISCRPRQTRFLV